MNSQIPFSPSNLLTMKMDVVMPHLVSSLNQIYIIEEDGDACSTLHRYRKEFLQSLQNRQKWNDKKKFKEQGCHCNQWSLARMNDVDTFRNGDVHSFMLCVAVLNKGNQTQIMLLVSNQPITQIMLLVENEINSSLKGTIRISQDETLTSWEEPDIQHCK